MGSGEPGGEEVDSECLDGALVKSCILERKKALPMEEGSWGSLTFFTERSPHTHKCAHTLTPTCTHTHTLAVSLPKPRCEGEGPGSVHLHPDRFGGQ